MHFTHLFSSSEDDEHGVLSLSSSNIERRRLAIVLNQKANSIDSKVQCFAFLFSQNENYDFAAISMATKSLTNNTRTKYSLYSTCYFIRGNPAGAFEFESNHLE